MIENYIIFSTLWKYHHLHCLPRKNRNQNEYFQGLYTLGAVFIYKNDENDFFYMGRKSTKGLKVKILSRNHLLEMVKTDMEYEEQRLSENEQDSSYILECYKKIYHNIKELI